MTFPKTTDPSSPISTSVSRSQSILRTVPTNRASDNSQEKKSNFAGFLEKNSWRKRPISREFRGNFRDRFRGKPKKKAKKKDTPQKKYIGRMSNSGQERKHKSSSNTVLKAIVLVSSYKKNKALPKRPAG